MLLALVFVTVTVIVNENILSALTTACVITVAHKRNSFLSLGQRKEKKEIKELLYGPTYVIVIVNDGNTTASAATGPSVRSSVRLSVCLSVTTHMLYRCSTLERHAACKKIYDARSMESREPREPHRAGRATAFRNSIHRSLSCKSRQLRNY